MNIHQQTISAAISAEIQIDVIHQSLPLYVATQEEMERFCAMCIEAGRVAEREECANVCEERSMRNEESANECIRNGENDEVSSIRSAAWQLFVCANTIRNRSTK